MVLCSLHREENCGQWGVQLFLHIGLGYGLPILQVLSLLSYEAFKLAFMGNSPQSFAEAYKDLLLVFSV